MKYITPVPPAKAHGLVRDVYRQIKHDFGAVVDPFAVHSISPRLMAAVWAVCRESEVVGEVPREIKEALAVAVSKRNDTPFCVDAHVVMLHALGQHAIAHAMQGGGTQHLPGPMRAILDWATPAADPHANGAQPPVGDWPGTIAAMVVRSPRSKMCLSPFPQTGYALSSEAAAEVIGTVVFFQYMNRMAIILLDETPLPSSQQWLKPLLSRVAGWYFSFAARRPKTPGDSLAFLPDAELPPDMAWAAANESVAGAWARLAREVELQGEAALPADVRRLAAEQIHDWQGDTDARDRDSIENSIAKLAEPDRNAARLVLLTALSPHQVNDKTIREYADPALEPEKLLGALSWASFTAARRIGALLHRAAVTCSDHTC